MPCRDYWPDANQEYYDKRVKEQRDKLARIACNALSTLEAVRPGKFGVKLALVDAGVSEEHIKELLTWWNQHKKDDEAAKRKEAQEKKTTDMIHGALSKLTPSEKKLLEQKGLLTLLSSTEKKKPAAKKKSKTKVND